MRNSIESGVKFQNIPKYQNMLEMIRWQETWIGRKIWKLAHILIMSKTNKHARQYFETSIWGNIAQNKHNFPKCKDWEEKYVGKFEKRPLIKLNYEKCDVWQKCTRML